MSKSTSKKPRIIHFNGIDRYYLIPETDDPNGDYFPMSLVTGLTLKKPLMAAEVVRGLARVNTKYPQFRLGYQLDYKSDRWVRVEDTALDQHLMNLVHEQNRTVDLSELLSQRLPENINPLSQPLSIELYENTVIFKVQHAFADGRFTMLMIPCILMAALDESAFDALPELSLGYSLPIWRVIWQSPQQGIGIFINWLKTFVSSYEEYKGPANKPQLPRAEPVKSGTPMSVVCQIIDREVMEFLDKQRKELSGPVKVSLNTLFQIIIARRLIELDLEGSVQTLTIPLDLRRYVKDQKRRYPGNLASQVRIRVLVGEGSDLAAICQTFQTQINERINRKLALATVPSEWLLALGGRKLYRKINRDWLVSSNSTDPRFFVISNLGILDEELGPLMPFLDPNSPVGFGIPLMGAPPLVFALLIIDGKGHLTVTYNPSVLSETQINDILQALTLEQLKTWATQEGSVVGKEVANSNN